MSNKVGSLTLKVNTPYIAKGLMYVQWKEKHCSKLSWLFGIYVAGGLRSQIGQSPLELCAVPK